MAAKDTAGKPAWRPISVGGARGRNTNTWLNNKYNLAGAGRRRLHRDSDVVFFAA